MTDTDFIIVFLAIVCLIEAWIIYVIAKLKFNDFEKRLSELPPKGSLDKSPN